MKLRLQTPATRRQRRASASRPRWELMLLALGVAHWAYHKNREWNELVAELLHSTPYLDDDLDLQFDAVPAAAVPPGQIDLTFPAQARRATR